MVRRGLRAVADSRLVSYLVGWCNQWYVYKFVRVDVHAKCPACGVRSEHKVVFSVEYGHVMHLCSLCSALWGEPPVAAWENWRVSQVQEHADEPKETTVITMGSRRT